MTENKKRLIIGIYNKDVLLTFDNLNDEFPKRISPITVDIRWETHPNAWYKTDYRLYNFYSTPLGRELEYPTTYDDLFTTLECVIYEHIIMGTIGIDDETGEWCPLAHKGENNMLDVIREIINGYEKNVKKLPIYQYKV